jgi:hypothetical protein
MRVTFPANLVLLHLVAIISGEDFKLRSSALYNCLDNVKAITSHNPTGLHGLLQ